METTAYYETPIGILRAVFDDGALCTLLPSDTVGVSSDTDTPAAAALGDALARYFSGDAHAFDDTVLRMRGTPFQRTVWQALRDIPFGQVRTYGEIAAAIGKPGAARAVGGACNRNHILLLIPCHRVTAAGGIGGFEFGVAIKQQLLRLEGAETFIQE